MTATIVYQDSNRASRGFYPNANHDKIESFEASPWTMHEFFAGSGMVAYGLRGMFSTVWANDISLQKALVYEANFGSEYFNLNDIKNIHGWDLPSANLSWASFPCQDLSLAGSIKGIYAPRSGLVWEWLRVLDEIKEKPRILALENVTGLLSTNGGDNYKVLHKAMMDRGYNCGAIVLNASDFVPQSRPRVFVIAVAQGCKIPDNLMGKGPCWLHNKAAARLGNELPGWIWWRTDRPPQRKNSLRDIVDEEAEFDKDAVLKLIPERHMKKLDESDTVYATGYRRTRQGKQQLELRFDGVAGCLRTPEGGSSRQYLVVKKDGEIHARLLTVREAARLMGAPDTFLLPGSYNDGYKAMGDAVAMPVAHFIGERFLTKLAEAVYHD
ncbi:MAG: DNA cytosine methyltransferase [Clostridiales bacterium]|nr:DNA cytosine methyltransferase [Clostridiales bacterium]